MADYRIFTFDDASRVLSRDCSTIIDKNGLNNGQKFEFGIFEYNRDFNNKFNDYGGDFKYYYKKAYDYSSEFFKINDNNTNIKFTKNGAMYTPSGTSYVLDSTKEVINSKDNGYYYTIKRTSDGNDVEFEVTPNFYNKSTIDSFLNDVIFEIRTNDDALSVTTSNDNYTIVNSAMRVNSKNSLFTFTTYDETTEKSFVDTNKTMNTTSVLMGNWFKCDSSNGLLIIDEDKNYTYFCPRISLIEGERGTQVLAYTLGKNNNFTISLEWNVFKFNKDNNNSDSYGIYVDSNKFIVGENNIDSNYKYPSIGFGSEKYDEDYKFIIDLKSDGVKSYKFYIIKEQDGVFYNDINLIENKDEEYDSDSYGNLFMRMKIRDMKYDSSKEHGGQDGINIKFLNNDVLYVC